MTSRPSQQETDSTPANPATSAPTSPAGTMRATVQDRYGDVDTLRLEQTVLPSIAEDEVLVRVHAAGMDRGTWHLMAGRPYLMRILGFGLRGPKNRVPGRDVAGTVVDVGARVTRFVVGDEVFGVSRGSFAEFAAAREDNLATKPPRLTFEEAAVVPISGLTALQAIRDAGHLQAGQRVLVIGASGGVGSYAVQIAKALGGQVTGVASTAKLDLVGALGADHVIDYTVEDFADGTHHYDLILDIGGNSTLPRLRRALTRTGTLVIVGGENGGAITGMSRQLRAVAISPFLHQRLTMHTTKERASDLVPLTELIESGRLVPSLDRTFPLELVPEAMRQLASGTVRGKVAIAL
jgi:NADPH:quinone reductase-like Zn-dependent oxidoreductase